MSNEAKPLKAIKISLGQYSIHNDDCSIALVIGKDNAELIATAVNEREADKQKIAELKAENTELKAKLAHKSDYELRNTPLI